MPASFLDRPRQLMFPGAFGWKISVERTNRELGGQVTLEDVDAYL